MGGYTIAESFYLFSLLPCTSFIVCFVLEIRETKRRRMRRNPLHIRYPNRLKTVGDAAAVTNNNNTFFGRRGAARGVYGEGVIKRSRTRRRTGGP